MISTITKRDGRKVDFNLSKIADAIYKAAQATGGRDYETAKRLAAQVEDYIENTLKLDSPTVEQVQDAVERILIENGHARTAKEFILYRANRSRVRDMNSKLMKTLEDLTFKDSQSLDMKRENANIDGDTAMGIMLKYGTESAKQFCEMFILDPNHSRAHAEGDIHIHDLDFMTLTTTCCQIDIDKLFTGGFSTGHGYLREPNDIQSYSALACITIQCNQNDQHGGQSIPNFDYALAKGVAKTFKKRFKANIDKAVNLLCPSMEDSAAVASAAMDAFAERGVTPRLGDGEEERQTQLEIVSAATESSEAGRILEFARRCALSETERATYQAMEALIHNLNTMHSRAGAQIPFSSINYGTDTSPEGRMIIRNILAATESGLGNGETAIFPIHIFKVKEGVNFNPGEPNYDLFRQACAVTAKRLFPNFSFIDAPFNIKYYKPGQPMTEAAYMGCRTRVVGNVYDPSREVVTGRGNLSFTSINLPRIAIKAHGNMEHFFEELDRKLDLVMDQLYRRYKLQAGKKVRNFPFLMGQGIWMDSDKLSPDDTIEEILKHGTLTVGFIGLAECLKALTGFHHGESGEAQNLGLEIIGYMRKRLDEKSAETHMNYTLIATPAEGLSGRFVGIDKAKFGVIPGVTDRDYYTNSFHIPVYYPVSAFDKIALEAPYHALTNAGHITYVELDGDPSMNVDAIESIIRCMKECGVGYGSINHPVDRDPVCGYTGIINDECPRCGRRESDGKGDFYRIRRVTGYLGTLDRFVNAKRSEERQRIKHSFECGASAAE